MSLFLCQSLEEDVRQLVILLHERRMKVIVDVNMTLGITWLRKRR